VQRLDGFLWLIVANVVCVRGVHLSHVILEQPLTREGSLAHLARIGPVTRMLHHVTNQRVLVAKVEGADLAGKVLLDLVNLKWG
jgi:hypothetical protein